MTTLDDVNWKNTVEFVPIVKGGKVIKVYDCDTITIATKIPYKADLPESNIIYRFHIRLNGIDTPEMKSSCEDEKNIACLAQKTLSELIMNKNVIFTDVYTEDELHLNKWAIGNRFAIYYDGGTKNSPKSWSDYYNYGVLK
jgi:endonuclease YncB( thermonuclease family)